MKPYSIAAGLVLLSTLAWADPFDFNSSGSGPNLDFMADRPFCLPDSGFDRKNGPFGNPSFEHGLEGWGEYMDAESKTSHCTLEIGKDFAHTGDRYARLSSLEIAHHSIHPAIPLKVQKGQRFRICAWLRAEHDAEVKPGEPGTLLRVTCMWQGASAPDGHYFVHPDGRIQHYAPTVNAPPMHVAAVPLPHEWTKFEIVFEVGPRVDELRPEAYAWQVKGAVDVDDFTIEPAPLSMPLSPISTEEETSPGVGPDRRDLNLPTPPLK